MLPNFICPGAQKSATTTLYDILNQHPDIYLPLCKETHFFDKRNRFKKGINYYEKEFYSGVKKEKIIGDITPIYMYIDDIPKKINNLLADDLKFIFMLRNPVDRAYSHYWMSYRRGYETENFEEAIKLEKNRIKKGYFEKSNFSYIDRGFYSRQILNFLKYFPKENMKFIIFDEFVNNTEETITKVLLFLGLEYYDELEFNKKRNTAFLPKSKVLANFMNNPPKMIKDLSDVFPNKLKDLIIRFIYEINKKEFNKPKLSKETRIDLINLYKPDIHKLEKIIDEDLSQWYEI